MNMKILDHRRFIELAKLCKATYAGPIRQSHHSYGGIPYTHQRIVHGSFGRGFCRIFWRAGIVTVAFRGTREIVDWAVSNIKALPVKLRDCVDLTRSVYVHRGFQRTLDFVDKTTKKRSLEAINYHLRENKLLSGQDIVITGHSLGGALATVFAVKFRSQHSTLVRDKLREVVTFGSPAVGGSSFYDYYGDLHEKTVRIVNGADLVAFTPPFGYRHVGNELWLGKNKTIANIGWIRRLFYATNILELCNLTRDHALESYICRLQQAIKHDFSNWNYRSTTNITLP